MKNNAKLNALVDDVEELLAELDDEHGPEVNELREQVGHAVGAVRRALHGQDSAVARIGRYARTFDAYIHDYPRLAFTTGALVAGGIGYLIGLAAAGSRRD